MSDDLNMPGVDKPAEAVSEVAKFGQGVNDIVKAGGQWASAVAGSLPHDLVGILGDKVRAYRIERAYELRENVVKRLQAKGYENARSLNVSPSLLLPMLTAAVDEDRKTLQDLWEKLIAAACEPKSKDRVRQSYIDLLKQLDPQDALLLLHASGWISFMEWKKVAYKLTSLAMDEIDVSFANLTKLGLIGGRGGGTRGPGGETSGWHITPLARLFLQAVS